MPLKFRCWKTERRLPPFLVVLLETLVEVFVVEGVIVFFGRLLRGGRLLVECMEVFYVVCGRSAAEFRN